MGTYNITIKGTGQHHNGLLADAENIAKRFIKELEAAGHAIEHGVLELVGSGTHENLKNGKIASTHAEAINPGEPSVPAPIETSTISTAASLDTGSVSSATALGSDVPPSIPVPAPVEAPEPPAMPATAAPEKGDGDGAGSQAAAPAPTPDPVPTAAPQPDQTAPSTPASA